MSTEKLKQNGKGVNILPLKEFAMENMKPYRISRNLILTETDVLSVDEFLVKIQVWLKVLDEEVGV